MTKMLALLCVAALSGLGAAARPAHASLNARVFAQLNMTRSAHGLAPLRPSPRLAAAARAHSSEMVTAGYFSHDSFDGSVFWRRIRRYSVPGAVGENLLWAMPAVSARRAVAMWMASPEHRGNILDPDWRVIGISAVHAAAAPGYFGGRAVTVVTTDFGAAEVR
jgi:uncharacterized protein YkwD